MNILEEANGLTGGDRLDSYGHPSENFENIALLWNAYLLTKKEGATLQMGTLNARDISMMMILFKVAREKNNHKRDNVVDMAGYARTLEMCNEE